MNLETISIPARTDCEILMIPFMFLQGELASLDKHLEQHNALMARRLPSYPPQTRELLLTQALLIGLQSMGVAVNFEQSQKNLPPQ